MNKDFWRDLYPMSETRRRFSRSSRLWIYLPVAAAVLLAAAAAVALLVSVPVSGPAHEGQLATIVLAAGFLAAGFVSWLAILACVWGLGDLLDVLPALTSRMRLRFVVGARSWRRGIYAFKRTTAAVARFFSPQRRQAPIRRSSSIPLNRRKESRDE
jgi:hypothetical protein